MKYLFSSWSSVKNRIKDARKVFILADYDGTLAPIADKPDHAVLPEKTRQLLIALAKRYSLAGRFSHV